MHCIPPVNAIWHKLAGYFVHFFTIPSQAFEKMENLKYFTS